PERESEVLNGPVVVAGVDRETCGRIRETVLIVLVEHEPEERGIQIAGVSRGDVRQSRGDRELVRQPVLELGDAVVRLRFTCALALAAGLVVMAAVVEGLESQREAAFAGKGKPGRLGARRDRDCKRQECERQNRRRARWPGAAHCTGDISLCVRPGRQKPRPLRWSAYVRRPSRER